MGGTPNNTSLFSKQMIVLFLTQFFMEQLRVASMAALILIIPAVAEASVDGTLDLNWWAIGFAFLLSILKGVDRALHETDIAKKGLTRF